MKRAQFRMWVRKPAVVFIALVMSGYFAIAFGLGYQPTSHYKYCEYLLRLDCPRECPVVPQEGWTPCFVGANEWRATCIAMDIPAGGCPIPSDCEGIATHTSGVIWTCYCPPPAGSCD
jgi:hypothetical protein